MDLHSEKTDNDHGNGTHNMSDGENLHGKINHGRGTGSTREEAEAAAAFDRESREATEKVTAEEEPGE